MAFRHSVGLLRGSLLAGTVVAAAVSGVANPLRANDEPWWLLDSAKQDRFNAGFEEVFAQTDDPEALAGFAAAAARIGDFEAAIATLERILLISPDLDPVRLELGVFYLRVGAPAVARYHLERALAGGNLSPAARDRAESFKSQAERRLSGHEISGVASLGVRYQSNANAAAEGVVRVRGVTVDADPFGEPEDDFNFFLSARGQHRYDLGTQYEETWDTAVSFLGSKQIEVDDVDLGYLSLRSGPQLKVLPKSIDGLTVAPAALAGFTLLDRGFNSYWVGGGVDLKKRFGTWGRLEAGYDLRHRDFDASDTSDGLVHELDFSGSLVLTEDMVVFAGVDLDWDRADAGFQANDRHGLRGGITFRYDAPFAVTPVPWQVTAQGSFHERRFDDPNPAVDPAVTRSDDEYRVTVRNTVGLTGDWSLFLEAEYFRVESNLPNHDFDNTSVSVGTSLRF